MHSRQRKYPRPALRIGSRKLGFDVLERRELLAAVVSAELFAAPSPRLVVAYDAPIDFASVSATDLRINNTDQAIGATSVNANVVAFQLPALGAGLFSFSIDASAILDSMGVSANAFVGTYNIVLEPQFTIKHTPRLQPGNAPLKGYAGSDTDRIDIMWQTVPGGVGSQDAFLIEYRPAGSSTWQLANTPSTLVTGVEDRVIHSTTIAGLNWKSDYDYRVRQRRGDVIVAEFTNSFRTRLQAGDTTPFTFAAYGDSHAGENLANFRSLQARINQVNPAFSVLLGDNASLNGSHPAFDARFDPLVNPETASWVASSIEYLGVGNHDIVTQAGLPTEQNFSVPVPVAGVTAPFAPPATERPEHNFSWDYGDVHFVTFDSNSYADPTRLSAQLDWVVADVGASTARWKIVYAHHPLAAAPFMPHTPAEDYYQQVVTRLKAAGVDLVMLGHTHNYSWTYPLTGEVDGFATYVNRGSYNQFSTADGLTQLVVGTGHELRSGSMDVYPFVARGFTTSTTPASQIGFALVDVAQGELNIRYISAATGETIDSLKLTKEIPAPDASRVATFQQKLTSYSGTADTILRQNSPATVNATAATLAIDNDDPIGTAQQVQTLLRFGNLFGPAFGQIPPDAQIEAATLQLQISNEGHAIKLHRMLKSWSDNDTWSSLGNGISADGIEALAGPDATTAFVSTGVLTLNVVDALRAWQADPTLNFGWALMPTGSNGVNIHSAEGTLPPKLLVQYKPAANRAPLANNDTAVLEANTSIGIAVLSNDSDPDNDLVSIAGISLPAHGTATLAADQRIVYTPIANFSGTDTFSYTITDGRGGSSTATVMIDVVAAAPPQTVTFQQRTSGYVGTVDTILRENTPTTMVGTAINLTVDADEPTNTNRKEQALLRFSSIFGDAIGQVPQGASLQSATLTLQITNEGHAVKLHRMLKSWTDADTWSSLVSGISADGIEALASADATTAFLSAGVVQIDVLAALQAWQANPASNFGWALLPTGKNGVAISSAEGVTPPKLSVVYTGRAAANRAPTPQDDYVSTLKNSAVLIPVLANDTDPDSDALRVSATSTASFGIVSLGTNGGVTYKPNVDFVGTDSFSYTVTDARGGSATALVTVTVESPTAPQTVSFQQRANNYLGTIDTVVKENSPTTSGASAINITVDNDEPGNTRLKEQALLRFGNLFGDAAGQIPANANIDAAILTLQVTNEGHAIMLHRMLRSWADTDTWATLSSGISADGIEAIAAADYTSGFLSVGAIQIDVLAALKVWQSNPAANFGWALLPTSKNGVAISSAEGATPPKLSVTYTPASSGAALRTLSAERETYDVNGDRTISPLDALTVINLLNRNGTSRVAASGVYPDVSRDGYISPLDALLIINRLNSSSISSQYISPSASSPVVPAPNDDRDALYGGLLWELEVDAKEQDQGTLWPFDDLEG